MGSYDKYLYQHNCYPYLADAITEIQTNGKAAVMAASAFINKEDMTMRSINVQNGELPVVYNKEEQYVLSDILEIQKLADKLAEMRKRAKVKAAEDKDNETEYMYMAAGLEAYINRLYAMVDAIKVTAEGHIFELQQIESKMHKWEEKLD